MSSATRLDTGRWIAKRKEAVTAPNVNRTAYGPRATPCQADDKLSRAREVGGRRRCGGAAPGVCVGGRLRIGGDGGGGGGRDGVQTRETIVVSSGIVVHGPY